MKTAEQIQDEIIVLLEDLRDRTKEKLDLIDAEETHGEELDDEALGEDFNNLEAIIDSVKDLDLSFIK